MNKSINILISPLEWGLGHAGRLIPLAKRLRELNHNIFIAAGQLHTGLFRSESCEATYISFPGFRPAYSKYLPQYLMIFLQLPLIMFHAARDHKRLRRVVEDYDIDLVISDNRFGLWHKSVKSVYITHQLRIPFPDYLKFLENAGAALHRLIINKYHFCLIPDLPGDINLTGRLAHGISLPGNARYIGILSRFMREEYNHRQDQISFPHNTVILSGPEPQRGIMRDKVTRILKKSDNLTVILEGKPGEKVKTEISGNLISHSHLTSSEMTLIIRSSSSIICRPGYSTIMELVSLGCTALLIPTPGQTEQEHLAGWLSRKGWFASVSQKEIGGEIPSWQNKGRIDEDIAGISSVLLEKALDEILKEHHQ